MKVRDIQKIFPQCASVTKPHLEFEGSDTANAVRCAYVLFLSAEAALKAFNMMKNVRIDGEPLSIEFRKFFVQEE